MLPTELAFSVEAISPHPALREPAALPQSRSVKGAKDASCYIHQLPPCKSPCRRMWPILSLNAFRLGLLSLCHVSPWGNAVFAYFLGIFSDKNTLLGGSRSVSPPPLALSECPACSYPFLWFN